MVMAECVMVVMAECVMMVMDDRVWFDGLRFEQLTQKCVSLGDSTAPSADGDDDGHGDGG